LIGNFQLGKREKQIKAKRKEKEKEKEKKRKEKGKEKKKRKRKRQRKRQQQSNRATSNKQPSSETINYEKERVSERGVKEERKQ